MGKYRLRVIFALFVATSVFLWVRGGLAGEQKPAGKTESDAKPMLVGGATPEEAFKIYQGAIEKDDWKSAFRHQTEFSRDYMVGGLLAACHQGAVGEAGKKLIAEFADAAKLTALMAKIAKLPPKEQSNSVTEVAAMVTMKPEFVSRVLKEFRDQKKENWMVEIGSAKLIRVKIDGDRATSLMELRVGKGIGREPLIFRRVKERWYIDYSDE